MVDGYKAKCTVVTPAMLRLRQRPLQFTKTSATHRKWRSVGSARVRKPAGLHRRRRDLPVDRAVRTGRRGRSGQPVTLRVRVRGPGERQVDRTARNSICPPGLEIYETKSQAKYVKDGSSFKDFEVLIIPRQPGRFAVPPVTLSTFDPETKAFVRKLASPALDHHSDRRGGPGGRRARARDRDVGGRPPPAMARPNPRCPALAGEMRQSAGLVRVATLTIASTASIYASCLAFLGLAVITIGHLRQSPAQGVARRRSCVGGLETSPRAGRAAKTGAGSGSSSPTPSITFSARFSERGGASLELDRLLEHTPPSLRNELEPALARSSGDGCEALSFAPESVMGSLSTGAADIETCS